MSELSARDRLLIAAAELTYDQGITATGVDAIAARAGVTKRTLYQQFGSKDALVGAALAARDGLTMMALRGAVQRRIDKGIAPLDALFAVLGKVFADPAFRGCAFLNAGAEMRPEEHAVHPVVRSHTDARRALIEELVRAEGVDDAAAIDAIALIVEGAFAVAASRREPGAIVRAQAAAQRVLQFAS